MVTGCPLCNGCLQWTASCPKCSQLVPDQPRLQDLVGPYSPYEEPSAAMGLAEPCDVCVHVANCTNCGTSSYVLVPIEV